jgi:hypothetical protein
MLLCSCGLFSPRTEFEQPVGGDDNDPFSFASLLYGTPEEFTKLELNELFADSMVYTNTRSASNKYYKRDMINRLRSLQLTEKIVVSWNNNGNYLPGSENIDLQNVTYTVKRKILPDSIVASGTSRFIITRSSKQNWQIMSWQDVPETGPAFFLPVAE